MSVSSPGRGLLRRRESITDRLTRRPNPNEARAALIAADGGRRKSEIARVLWEIRWAMAERRRQLEVTRVVGEAPRARQPEIIDFPHFRPLADAGRVLVAGVTEEQLAQILGTAVAQMRQWLITRTMPSDASDRLSEFAFIVERASTVIPGTLIGAWLTRQPEIFAGETPLSLLARGEGARVVALLSRLEHGTFS